MTYLRVSVTDRCNLRCRYCMPQTSFSWMPHDSILSYEEILKVCGVLAGLGVTKIRLTGGEPLVRKGLVGLVERVAAVPGISDLGLTTNGVLLERYARDLHRAGLRRINVSLDSLKRSKFADITGRDLLSAVWRGIEAAMAAGFSPIKINSVILSGVNDDEIPALAALSMKFPVEVRFIEFMPVGQNEEWQKDRFMSEEQIRTAVEVACGPLAPVRRIENSGPASVYSLQGAKGRVGFISALSHRFCSTCNRLRLTADGRLRLCLFSDVETDVKTALRRGATQDELQALFRRAVLEKPTGYGAKGKSEPGCARAMFSIGG